MNEAQRQTKTYNANLISQYERQVDRVSDDLRRLADVVDRQKNVVVSRNGSEENGPYSNAARRVVHEIFAAFANLPTDRLLEAAYEVDTITEEVLIALSEQARREDAAKTEQWFDGEKWHPVALHFPHGATVSHYFVRGFGQDDWSVCGRATASYSSTRIGPTPVLTCKVCASKIVRR